MKQKNLFLFFPLCVFGAVFVLDANAASSVRNLGGTGTYSSASVAKSASTAATKNSSKSDSNSVPTSLRGGSVRVTSGSGLSGTSTTLDNVNRSAEAQRFSLGKFLGGGTSISGGSSIKPQSPSDSSSSSGVSADVQEEIDNLRKEIQKETDALREETDLLRQEKQDVLVPAEDGLIILDERTNEISINLDSIKSEIGDIDISGKEDVSNKVTSLDQADADNNKYPSAMAVKNAMDSKVDTGADAVQTLSGTYTVEGVLIVPTQPLP